MLTQRPALISIAKNAFVAFATLSLLSGAGAVFAQQQLNPVYGLATQNNRSDQNNPTAPTGQSTNPAQGAQIPAPDNQSGQNAGSNNNSNSSDGGKSTTSATSASGVPVTSSSLVNSRGIVMPMPAPPSGMGNGQGQLSNNASDLATQAEQAALRAQADAEEVKAQREEEHNRKSFERAESGLFPLSDTQIRAFMQKMENSQTAALSPYAGPPKANVRIVDLKLDPGVEPPQINLASNYVTTIDVLDSSGAPWPILDVGVGGSFEVSPTASGSHVVRIMPLSRVANGNLSILLKDLATPVIFRLSSGGTSVDLRYEVRVPKFGPNGKVPLVSRPPLLEAGDDVILALLQNNPPGEAKRLKIGGLDARSMAWTLGAKTYVRTPLTLLSPAWTASVSSADGTTVYEIGDAPVLLMSDNGAVVRARLVRDEDHD